MNALAGNFKSLKLVLLLGFFHGSAMVVSRYSIGQFYPLGYAALRFVLAALLLIPMVLTSGSAKRFTSREFLFKGIFVGAVGTALPYGAFISSLQYQSSGVTSLLLTVTPVVTLLLSALFIKSEKITIRALVGSVIGLGGAFLLIILQETGLEFAQADVRGYVLVGIGIIGGAFGAIALKKFCAYEGLRSISLIRAIVAAILLTATAGCFGALDFSQVQLSGWLALIYASAVGTFSAIMLQAHIVAKHGPARASQAEYVTPVTASILGVIFIGEIITVPMTAGMILIFIGLQILSRHKKTISEGRSAHEQRKAAQSAGNPPATPWQG